MVFPNIFIKFLRLNRLVDCNKIFYIKFECNTKLKQLFLPLCCKRDLILFI